MGVERQAAKVNWLTSMAMIVMAGTVFRMGKWMGKINKVKISELQERAGLILKGKPQQLSIVPKPASRQPGAWEQVLRHRQQYHFLYKLNKGSLFDRKWF